jgi:hypothetical protein
MSERDTIKQQQGPSGTLGYVGAGNLGDYFRNTTGRAPLEINLLPANEQASFWNTFNQPTKNSNAGN